MNPKENGACFLFHLNQNFLDRDKSSEYQYQSSPLKWFVTNLITCHFSYEILVQHP